VRVGGALERYETPQTTPHPGLPPQGGKGKNTANWEIRVNAGHPVGGFRGEKVVAAGGVDKGTVPG
jgi:hypothetical protein